MLGARLCEEGTGMCLHAAVRSRRPYLVQFVTADEFEKASHLNVFMGLIFLPVW